MGIDLVMLASNFREREKKVLSTATIRLDRDQRVLSLFSKLTEPCIVSELPAGVKVGHFEDDGLKYDENDRYGNPLTFTTPERLRSLRILDEIADWNRAAPAFASALSPGTRIILYWC
jgi:hypothetical protein